MAETAAGSGAGEAIGIAHPLWTFLTVLSGISDERERAGLTATGLSSLLPCRISGVALLDAAEKNWDLILQENGQPLASTHTEGALAALQPLFWEAFRRPPVLIARADEQTSDCRIPVAIEKLGIQRLAVVPLRTLRHRLGILFVGRRGAEMFSREDELLLSTLAEHSAIGIENLRLYSTLKNYSQTLEDQVSARTAQLRQAEERRRILLRVNNAIITNLDRASLLDAITQALREVLPFDRAVLTLRDPATDVLQVVALTGTSPAKDFFPIGTAFPLQGSHLASVFETKRPHVRRDLADGPCTAVEQRLLAGGIRSYVSVPLMAKREPFGTLNLGNLAPDRFSDAEAELLFDVGQQVALAVANMLAYEEIAQLKLRLERENRYLQEEIKTQHNFEEILGESPVIKSVVKAIETVAPTEANVLITGETGTGKELVARAVHNLSARRDKTLITVNCSSIPRELFESEFFGHVKGAFTGALRDRVGRFELADKGTLFLDEVGEIPLEMQSKLLRVLQDGEYEPVGEESTRKVDVRIIAATNRDLDAEVAAGRFRQDLYYRLNVFPIDVAPLRERREDIVPLAAHFLEKASRRLNRPQPHLTEAHVVQVQSYEWPGNIRELQNFIERCVILSEAGRLPPRLPLPVAVRTGDEGAQLPLTEPSDSAILTSDELRDRERKNIIAALGRTAWRISGPGGAAELLGLKSSTLTSRMKALGIRRPASRSHATGE